MKLSTVVLAGSLAANAALIAAIAVGLSDDRDSAKHTALATAANTKTSTAKDASSLSPEAWNDLQNGDLAALRDRLRAEGFPPEIVRAILAAQIRESFAARRKAIEDAQGETPYWKNPNRDPKTQAALRDLNREQDKILKDLLGNEARDDDPSYTAYLHRQFGDLPADKVDRLRDIQDDYNRQRSDIYANNRGGLLPDEQQKIAALDKGMRADFAAVLTPQELADYDLRSSNTAQQLRNNLAAFDATEQEYRAIFQLQQAFDDQFGRMYGPPSPEDMKARSDAQKQLTQDINTALGPDRAAEYQRDTDYSYRQATQLVERLELPPDTANQIYTAQKDIQQRATALRTDRTLTADDRNSQLAGLATEAQTTLTATLGAQGYQAYTQNGMGSWMQNIVPRPAPPRAK
jgi:hypothetical protein